MRIRSPRDFWAGLLFIAFAIVFVALASRYRFGEAQRMGPGYFPIFIGAILVGLGAILAIRAFAIDGPPIERFVPRPLAVTLIAVVLFGMTLDHFGLAAAIAALVVVSAFAEREVRLRETIVLALVLVFFSVAAFVWVLGLPLQVWPQW
jgi:hypothetical protein